MITSYIGVGSNLGNRRQNIDDAIAFLDGHSEIFVGRISSIYQTDPAGGPADQEKFLNGVVEIRTSLHPISLLRELDSIEKRLKRTKTVKNGPRTIDLDILAYGDRVMERPGLSIPHPQITSRNFVLEGFCQIAPDYMHPLLKKSIKELYENYKKHKRDG